MSTLGGVAAVAVASITYKPCYIFYAIFNKGLPIYVFGILFLALSAFIRWGDKNAFIMFLAGGLFGFLSQNLLYKPFEKIKSSLAKVRSFVSSNDNFIKHKAEQKISDIKLEELSLKSIANKMDTFGSESLSVDEIEFLRIFND